MKGVNETIAKPEGIHQINPENISISQDSVVMPGSVLDASAGKVIVEASALIEPYVYIKGPAYIGKKCYYKNRYKKFMVLFTSVTFQKFQVKYHRVYFIH